MQSINGLGKGHPGGPRLGISVAKWLWTSKSNPTAWLVLLLCLVWDATKYLCWALKQKRHLLKRFLRKLMHQKAARAVWTHQVPLKLLSLRTVCPLKRRLSRLQQGCTARSNSCPHASPCSQSPWALGVRTSMSDSGRMCCRKMRFSEPPGKDPSWQQHTWP